ncbi:MAG: class I SAM-dependent methyltransferase, partial [Rubrivivax sp.]|nr:class I SAM-dependent methyltransferase [Rubrivivax sp.]
AVEIINDYFPSPRASGPYDLIFSNAVLEHVADPEAFLAAVRNHLTPGGALVLSVPDCSREIALGDPAMLIHEHYNYFDANSLKSLLHRCGFAAETHASGYGRTIYASAAAPVRRESPTRRADLEAIQTYPARCKDFIDRARAALTALAAQGTLGIYCPTRALAVLPPDLACRFFDDSGSLQGKFVPPFAARIESRAALLESATDAVVIMSHTFVDRLKQELAALLPSSRLLGIAELVEFGTQVRTD